jgi:hypothetical protein
MAKKQKKETKEERAERLTKSRFFEVMSITGDVGQSARVVGMGMQKAYRALADPDGLSKLEKHLAKKGKSTYYTMDYDQRIALLTKCVLLGYMPRVVFDQETGEPTSELVYESVGINMRLKCMDMINKMTCAYVEKKIVETVPGESKDITPDVRSKLDEVYSEAESENKEEIDPLAY